MSGLILALTGTALVSWLCIGLETSLLTFLADPLLLFNEIIGVIEGSEAALNSESGYLDRPTYLALGATSQKIFAGRREVVYDLFQKYLRYKPKGSWDSAER